MCLRSEVNDVLAAVTYALRRGGISLRLRTEDPQTVARECGTSLQMLSRHYAFAIEDLRHQEPRPADVEWQAARDALLEKRGKPASSGETRHDGGRRRDKLRSWFTGGKRHTRGVTG
jgi:hypothetical protein